MRFSTGESLYNFMDVGTKITDSNIAQDSYPFDLLERRRVWASAIGEFYRDRYRLILYSTILALAALAWFNRFIQDDAFISFRYADNLLNGHGLVWNIGERVEGYTNFLWTVVMAVPMFLGLDPIASSYLLGIALLIGSLTLTYQTALLVLKSKTASLLTAIFLGTNYTYSSYATGGLETQLQALTFVASTFLLLRMISSGVWSATSIALLSLVLGIAMLTRLDSGLLLLVIFPVAAYFIIKENSLSSAKLTKLTALTLPLAILVGSWWLWKLSYYGDILPNTFYLKGPSSLIPIEGVHYVYLFFLSYLLFPFALLFPFLLSKLGSRSNRLMLIPTSLVAIWLAYVVVVNGDFMEFRLLVPILPFIFVLVSWVILNVSRQRQIRLALVLLVLLGSLHSSLMLSQAFRNGWIQPISQLNGWILDEDTNWREIGIVLGDSFEYSPHVTIATSAAGAIPYYSRLRTVDMLGLNDPWVARHGISIASGPGHTRLAPLSYMSERNVNLVIGHPYMKKNSDIISSEAMYTVEDVDRILAFTQVDPREVPSDAQFVEIPITEMYTLVSLYLVKSAIVDEFINENEWSVYPITKGLSASRVQS